MRIHPDRIFRFAVFILILSSILGRMCYALPVCCAESVVVAAMSKTPNGSITESKGTAFVVYSNERGSVLLTCKHVVRGSSEVWIAHSGDWHLCSHVYLHPTEDVAAMECNIRLKATGLTENIPTGAEVIVDGAGPALHKTEEEWFFRGRVVDEGEVRGEGGLAVIEGDSGGPVYVKMPDNMYAAGGIAFAYPRTSPGGLTRRDQHCRFNTTTLYTPTRKFMPWLTAQYCPNGQCPIQIRPQVIQPFGPLGIPRGPARVIGIAEPVPQQYTPVQPPQASQPSYVAGPPGRDGAQGPPGPPGEPGRSVKQQEIEAVVNAWLDSNRELLRGRDGAPGDRGLVGVPDNEDIANWLNGALSDPNTRETLRQQLRDLLAEDPKIQELMRRIESSSASRSADLELVGNGNTTLGRSRITIDESRVIVESKTADGKPAGSRYYPLKQPIRLNLSGSSK